MKAGREHRVALSDAAMEIIRAVERLRCGADALVFPGGRTSAPLSDVAVSKALRTACAGNATVHGMRSAFRDRAGEATSVPARSDRDGFGASRRRRGRASVRAWRSVLEAAPAHAGMGGVLFAPGTGRRGGAAAGRMTAHR